MQKTEEAPAAADVVNTHGVKASGRFAADDAHLPAYLRALDLSPASVRVTDVTGHEGYRCGCGEPATWFVVLLRSGETVR